MKPDDHLKAAATEDDIRQAIAGLSPGDLVHLKKAARLCLPGTEYADPQELLNEAVVRTMNAVAGQPGRCWPTDVPFMAYLVQTMKGLASDARESLPQRKTVHLEMMTTSDGNSETAVALLNHVEQDAITRGIEMEDEKERSRLAQADLDTINAHFAHDDQVQYVIMGRQDNLSVTEVRQLADMSQTQFETAQRRLRRGLEKLFSDRRKS